VRKVKLYHSSLVVLIGIWLMDTTDDVIATMLITAMAPPGELLLR
jgi:hypothetical protein